MREDQRINRADVLTVGCSYKPVRGGIAQVLYIYDNYVFEKFDFIANSKWSGWRNLFVLVSSLAQFVWRLASSRRIRIVHIHTSVALCFYRASIFVLLAKLFRRQVIIHAHGGAFKDFYVNNPKVIGRILNLSDCIVVLSPSWKAYFEGIAPKPLVRIVPNPVVLPSEEELKSRPKASHIRLLFLGLLANSKGIYDLLQVLSEHKEYFIGKLVLHVGGNGDTLTFEKTVDELGLSDLVVFYGWLSGEDKRRALINADVFILPSYFEGVPMAILEAFAYGLAVISTHVGGIPDIVDSQSGILFAPGDREAMFAALKSICEDPIRLSQLQTRSLGEGHKYSTQAVAKSLEALYDEMLGN